jgi:L-aminopeptidase/D-esterase-like protein
MTEPGESTGEVNLRVPGVRVGHWTDPVGQTGCTVTLLPEGSIVSGEVRGAGPATREYALLAPDKTVSSVHAVVLSGGSAFGLAAGDGVMRFCEEHGIGFETEAGRIPIVVGLSCFDLLSGDAKARPTAQRGYDAAVVAEAATGPTVSVGRVGAGTGAVIGAWRGLDEARPSGIGAASVERNGLIVSALFVVNAFGDIDDGGDVIAKMRDVPLPMGEGSLRNTTIGVVVTNARLTKIEANLVAQSGHDGLGRALIPAHTSVDGDAIVVAGTGSLDQAVPVDDVRLLAVVAVERAIRSVGA